MDQRDERVEPCGAQSRVETRTDVLEDHGMVHRVGDVAEERIERVERGVRGDTVEKPRERRGLKRQVVVERCELGRRVEVMVAVPVESVQVIDDTRADYSRKVAECRGFQHVRGRESEIQSGVDGN